MPDLKREAEEELQRKQSADLVLDVKGDSETLILIESQSKLPPFDVSAKRQFTYTILKTQRNRLQRPLPRTIVVSTNQVMNRPVCEARPTIDILKGSLHCRQWTWQFTPGPIGKREQTITFAPDERYTLWLRSYDGSQQGLTSWTNKIFFTGLEDYDIEQPSSNTATPPAPSNDASSCKRPPIMCLIAPCPPAQQSLQDELNCRLNTPTATARCHQLIMAGYITKKVDAAHIVDAADYLTVMGINVLTSGGMRGNGGTDRSWPISTSAGSEFRRPHFINTNLLSVYKVGDYVYLSCTASSPEPTSCGLDSAGKDILIAPSQARLMALLELANRRSEERSP